MPLALAIAVGSLLVGPILASLWPHGRTWRRAIDGLALVLVVVLTLAAILPHAVERAGWLAAGLGFGLVLVAGVVLKRLPGAETWLPGVFVALVGLHAVFDGAVLAMVDQTAALALGVAIAAHRLPVGLAVHTAALHAGLPLRGWLGIAGLIAATILGYVTGDAVAELLPGRLAGAAEAAVAAALLHIVAHPHGEGEHDHDH